jgi:hypothetical protein
MDDLAHAYGQVQQIRASIASNPQGAAYFERALRRELAARTDGHRAASAAAVTDALGAAMNQYAHYVASASLETSQPPQAAAPQAPRPAPPAAQPAAQAEEDEAQVRPRGPSSTP